MARMVGFRCWAMGCSMLLMTCAMFSSRVWPGSVELRGSGAQGGGGHVYCSSVLRG